MGAAKPLDKEITQYLGQLSVHQKEVVLSVVKTLPVKKHGGMTKRILLKWTGVLQRWKAVR